jgi:UDP-N-acetylmuramoyl-L-alanyl-D-glutamate--2,6-diaminopimelate ligase
LQAVRVGQPFAVLVDYAHTDDAMENVLSALRPLTRGSLRILFGCGGDRDRTKRPRMARTAIGIADAVYITSDNPRTEDANFIISEIVAGIPQNNRKPVIVEPDRNRAIERIIADAKPNDVVLLAGKGHENYQILGKTEHHFDDVEEATKAIKTFALR